MNKYLFITWERHQRTRSLCNKMDIKLFEVLSSKTGLRRYLDVIPRTIHIIRANKPRILFVQNPSLVLAILAVIFKYFFRYELIIDAHNEAIEPFIHNTFIVRALSKLIISLANKTIVTNNVLEQKVNDNKGEAIILPDFLPDINPRGYLALPENTPCEITLICTYAADEPYKEVFEAIGELGASAVLNVTGRIPEELKSAQLPVNIKLVGFLSEHDYWETLFKSHIIIDLTTMKDCLVCGAYEALAIEKPILLSASEASQLLFGSYAYHVENTTFDIKRGLSYLIENYNALQEPIHRARLEFLHLESLRINELKKTLVWTK